MPERKKLNILEAAKARAVAESSRLARFLNKETASLPAPTPTTQPSSITFEPSGPVDYSEDLLKSVSSLPAPSLTEDKH